MNATETNGQQVPNSRCARCTSEFRCGAIAGDTHCHCDSRKLTADTLQYLRERYTGCLCANCLHEFAVAGHSADR